jgi:hypothetical protein
MTISQEIISEIARYAQMAPSGDNLQDWRLSLNGDTLELIGEFDDHPFNFNHRPSLTGYGAVLENARIASEEFGFEMIEELFPEGANKKLISSLRFSKSPSKNQQPLFPYLETRAVNRGKYQKKELPPEMRKELVKTAEESGFGKLLLTENSASKQKAAKAAFFGSQIMMEHQGVHQSLFQNIRWTQAEAEKTRDGLFIKTLELGFQEPAFRLLRSWTLTSILNFFGLSLFAAFRDYQLSMGSSALGLIEIPDDSPQSILNGGKLFERLWLKMSSLGLSLQPESAIVYFLHLFWEQPHHFTPSQRRVLEKGARALKEAFPMKNEKGILMLFRLGYASKAPSTRSLRKLVEI